jgi:formylglycine-generating enzyme required for sulfatase activity
MTTLHAKLYDQADEASRAYDASTLTAMTARIKSIDANDPRIISYTDQISLIYTLERLAKSIQENISNNQIYEDDQNDAVHNLLIALNLDPNYPPILELKQQLLNYTRQQAMRSAQELDFSMADEQFNLLKEIDDNHSLTLQTKIDIDSLKQNRFSYLDQQFYLAINDLNLSRAEEMIEELSELEIAFGQLDGYQNLLKKTKTYGPFEVSQKFNDVLKSGQPGPDMVVMPVGEYHMGTQLGAKHQRPIHLVQIDYGFAVSQNEITVGEFAEFIQATSYITTAEKNSRAQIYDEGTGRFKEKYNINWRHDYLGKNAAENLPVIHVSWIDAQAYASWLNSSTGENYRLLSESEFEYLLADNKQSLYPWGNETPTQVWGNFSGAKDKFKKSRIRWREGFTDYEDGFWGPAPVGSFISSLNGLNDLSGNVMEWVEDCWHDSYTRAPDDGSAWVNRGCENRVIRGGNWGSAIEEYQVNHRKKAQAELTDPRLGFRVAKTFNFNEK